MCSNANLIYSFKVLDTRLDKAVAAIRAARTKLTTEQAVEVIAEIGYADAIYYDDEQKLQLNMSHLQLVVTAAALLAVAETGGVQEVRQ